MSRAQPHTTEPQLIPVYRVIDDFDELLEIEEEFDVAMSASALESGPCGIPRG